MVSIAYSPRLVVPDRLPGLLDGERSRGVRARRVLGPRLLGAVGAVASAPLLALAQSAGASLMVAPCVAIVLLSILSVRLSGMQRLFLIVMLTVISAAFALVVVTMGDTLLAGILEGSGKDATLEVGPNEMRAASKLRFSSCIKDIAGCRVFIVTVPTPVDLANRPDLVTLQELLRPQMMVPMHGEHRHLAAAISAPSGSRSNGGPAPRMRCWAPASR